MFQKGFSASSAYKVFDGDDTTLIGTPVNKDLLDGYVRLQKTTETEFVPWTIYGLEVVCDQANNANTLPKSIKLYGSMGNINDSLEITTLDFLSVAPVVDKIKYRYQFVFETPVRYASYAFSNFLSVNSTGSVIVSEIRFLRSKADIIAEGGTV